MIYLKQSTASQAVLLGPFIDDTDGKTAETGLTVANTDIRLSKNGGNMAAKNSGGGTHDEAGWYTITLDATDTNTVGRLQISAHVTGALPVWVECHVLEEAIYDALFGASADAFDANARIKGVAGTKNTLDALNDIAATAVVSSGAITTSGGAVSTVTSVTNQVTANVTAISGDSVAADNLEADYDGTGYNKSASTIGTCTTNADMRGTDSAATAANLGTPSNLGSGATVSDMLADMAGGTFSNSTDSLEAIRDRGDSAWTTGAGGSDRLLMVDTTIATLASQTSFTLAAGSADDDAYNGCTIVIEDVSTSTQKAIGIVDDYTGSTKTVTLLEDPGVFTMATTDKVYILAEKGLKPTTAANYHVDVSSGGTVGVDWANVDGQTTSVTLSNTTVGTVTTNTDLVTAAAVRTEMDSNSTQLAEIVADTNELQGDWANGGRLDLILDELTTQGDTNETKIDTVDTVVDALATTLTTVDGNVTTIDANVDALLELRQMVSSSVSDVSPTATGFDTALTAADDFYNDALLVFTSGSLAGQSRPISDYANASGAVSFTEGFTSAPSNGDTFRIVVDHIHPTSQIADAILDEALSGHTTAGTLGKAVADIETDATAILADTNELQGDWTDGGRLDVIVDAILVDTGTTIPGVLGTPAGADLATDIATVDSNVDAILVDTGTTLPATLTTIEGKIDTVDTVVDSILVDTAEIGAAGAGLTAIWTTALTESYGTDGSALTGAQLLYLINAGILEHSISGTTKTTKKLDGSTTAATYTLDDATNPTSITRAT